MHRQPDCRLVRGCPFDPVSFVRRNHQKVARLQLDGLFVAIEPQPSRPFQHHDPFVLVLVIPESVGRGMAAQGAVAVVPRSARFAGVASIGLWSLVIVFGRLIPYLPSWIPGVIP